MDQKTTLKNLHNENALLRAQLQQAQDRVRALEEENGELRKKIEHYSWKVSPDRQGGYVPEDEIMDQYRWR